MIKKILSDWDLDAIQQTILQRNQDKAIVKARAEPVQPEDTYRLETKMDDNWLVK